MLGMMNSPSDAVEFYATNESMRNGMSEEDLKTFTEAKPRKTVTYTKDGRRMIDGKIEDTESGEAMVMWGNTILRGAVRAHLKVEGVDMDKNPSEDAEEESKEESEKLSENKQQSSEEKGKYVQIIEIVEHPVLAKSPPREEQI